MGREQYKMSDEDVAAEFDRVCRLFQLALGRPSDRAIFDALMGEAGEQGLNWVEGLQYVVEHRQTEEEFQGQKRTTGSVVYAPPQEELRRAS